MRFVVPVLAVALAAPAAAQARETSPPNASRVTLYEGGLVWNGDMFEPRTLAVSGDRILDARALKGDEADKVDVRGKYLVPAYGNAHCHVTNPGKQDSDSFLRQGVFYVWNPNSVVVTPRTKAYFGRPDTYDLKIAMGGITEPGGHPEKLYVEYLTRYVYKGRDRAWFVGNAFHYGETPAEIDRALDKLQSQGADFVKAYLLHSEDWAERHRNPKYYGQTGLNPANFPFLVEAAHRRGLRVAVHVETAHDARVAAGSGADMLAHMPGYDDYVADGSNRLTPADARVIAASGMVVVPTAVVGAQSVRQAAADGKPDPNAGKLFDLQRHNLTTLKRAGARLLIGTDGFGDAVEEAERWVELGAMTPKEATRLLLSTGAWLFPEERVGCLKAGCRADFLALSADPTRRIDALKAITLRVKQGRVVTPD